MKFTKTEKNWEGTKLNFFYLFFLHLAEFKVAVVWNRLCLSECGVGVTNPGMLSWTLGSV